MKKIIRFVRIELLPLLIMVLLVTAARSSLADHYYVPTGSMEYSVMPGDRLVVDKEAYGLRLPYTRIHILSGPRPARGDVVIFNSPQDGMLLVKRVVAVAGDRVSLINGRLTVNGKSMELPSRQGVEEFRGHVALLDLKDGGGPDLHGIVVPPGKLLVLGDHRGDSLDGRFFGFINAKDVYGRAIGIYYRRGKGFVWRKL